VQYEGVARELHVERRAPVEAVFPNHLAAQIIDMKLARLLDGKDTQGGNRLPSVKSHTR
jgi:hypothetical protein